MEGITAPARPKLAEQASQFMRLERAVEEEFRPRLLAGVQRRVEAVAETAEAVAAGGPGCGQAMRRKDTRTVSWLARFWTSASAGFTLPLRALPSPVSASAGFTGRGSGTHQRFTGPFVGPAGSSGAVSAGGASGLVVAGCDR